MTEQTDIEKAIEALETLEFHYNSHIEETLGEMPIDEDDTLILMAECRKTIKSCLEKCKREEVDKPNNNWEMKTVVMEKSQRIGFFTNTSTVICGRWQLEHYMRLGYLPNWDKTDKARPKSDEV